ncbi:MAG: hypothetical protein M1453_09350 [Acidobacteria bacterium]|nr:hypothetical protein [Acidobacteriota bacterium]MCL5288182.1 hypothetical protein [Acidobacteriota bacterium]
MKAMHKAWMALGVLALALAMAPVSQAQLNSNQATVALNATLAESLTVTAGPAVVSFILPASGISNGSAPVAITTSWALAPTRTNVSLYAYFATVNALTDGGGNNIPTANVNGSVNAGPFGAFTGGAGPFGTESIQVFSQAIGAANWNSSRNDSVALQIDTTGLGLPSGTYTGTLNIQAQAI